MKVPTSGEPARKVTPVAQSFFGKAPGMLADRDERSAVGSETFIPMAADFGSGRGDDILKPSSVESTEQEEGADAVLEGYAEQNTLASEDGGQVDADSQVQRRSLAASGSSGHRLSSGAFFPSVQPKLTIGRPDDPLEREADLMAERVTGAGRPTGPQNLGQGGVVRHSVQRLSASDGEASVQSSSVAEGAGPGGSMSSRIRSPGGGRPLGDSVRNEMEGAFGADFSSVRIHDSSQDRTDADHLGAIAFTHKEGIWFGSHGSADDRRLMAHELTHVLQQRGERGPIHGAEPSGEDSGHDMPTVGGADLANPGGLSDHEWLSDDPPSVQAAWYNVSIPFTDYEFDPSIRGLKTAAGLVKDTAVESSNWLKDQVVDGFHWIVDKIGQLVSEGLAWLERRFAEIKSFAKSSFKSVRNSLSSLLGAITAPAGLVMSAFRTLDAGSLGSAWEALKTGVGMVSKGMTNTIRGVLKVGTDLWDSASAYVSELFGNVRALMGSWVFDQLPGFLKNKARSLFKKVRDLWRTIRDFAVGMLRRLKEFAAGVLRSIKAFASRVLGFALAPVLEAVEAISSAWRFVKEVSADPEGFVRPMVEKLAAKLNREVPDRAVQLGVEKLQENFKSDSSGGLVIQRQATSTKPERTTASPGEVLEGFTSAITQAWKQLDVASMLMTTLTQMFWPPATIRAIGHEFYELWNTDWANAANSLFVPRNILDDFVGFFHDLWSNLLVLLDFPLALWRRLNNILMLLVGYVTIILIIAGAVVGGTLGAAAGGVGAIPGALAGAGIGLEIASSIGLGLLASYLAAEGVTVVKSLLDLFTARQTRLEKGRDYVQIAGSLIGMATAIVLVAVLWFLSSLIGLIVRNIKGAKVKPPPESAKSAEPAVEAGRSGQSRSKPSAKDTQPVRAVEGKPNTFEVLDVSALKATKPSRIQGPQNSSFLHWKLYVELPNGKQAVFCEVNLRFRGSPDLNLHPKTATVPGAAEPVHLMGKGFKWTTESLKLVVESYRAKFGHPPKNMGGFLAKSNLANFQNTFARIRAERPGLPTRTIGELAIREISFGKQRIQLGYKFFRVSVLRYGRVKLKDGTTQVVPTEVRVEVGRTPIQPSQTPPSKPPGIPDNPADDGGDEKIQRVERSDELDRPFEQHSSIATR